MDTKIIEVRNNIGNGKLRVQIISNMPISNTVIKALEQKTLDEARAYGKIKGLTIRILED